MSVKSAGPLESEWPYRVPAGSIGVQSVSFSAIATPDQCRDLARRVKAQTIENVKASFSAVREGGGSVIAVTGRVEADVVQSCVITGAPVLSHVDEAFEGWFGDYQQVVSLSKARRERMANLVDSEEELVDERDDPEPVDKNGMIDLGELAAQYLCLAIDPYPRAPGAESDAENEPIPAPGRPNPFAALKGWKAGRDK